MKLAIFHYHLNPGGVTDVIVFSVRILLSRLDSIQEIRLVTGCSDNTERILGRIREGFEGGQRDKIRLDVLDEIAYTEGGEYSNPDKLAERLEARYDKDTIFWVHNYHIGKNPALTMALMKLAARGSRDMLLQIHDFPECGRPENLRRIDNLLDEPPYPGGARIRYAVVNERDLNILLNSGLEGSVYLLPNPVPIPRLEETNSIETKKALEELPNNPGYIPKAPILLYPVRAIRRKNIFESALFASVLYRPANLIVTLPGISAQEKSYSNLVEGAYKEGIIPGAWCPEASGDARLSYTRLISSCDAVISTSVQEGFGYLFLNSLLWRKPLLARYLDILDGILELFGDYPRRFWTDFRIPATPEIAGRTKTAYLDRIRQVESSMPEKTLKSVATAISKLAAGGGIDVSYLSVKDQFGALRLAREDRAWLDKTRSLNQELLKSAERTLRAKPQSMNKVVECHLGDSRYLKSFIGIVRSFGSKRRITSPEKIGKNIKRAFGRIDYLRLLYDTQVC